MIKKSVFEDEIIAGMQRKLAENDVEEGMFSLIKAVDYINSAVDILEEQGMQTKADQLLYILLKIAEKHQKKPTDLRKIQDKHKPRNSEEMIKNLLHHGTVFNMSDDGAVVHDDSSSDDLLDVDISDELDVDEKELSSFEEELD